MKLYYSPGACSLAPHIVLREAELSFELVKVDLAAKRTGDGRDYLSINPKGYVPALELDDGRIITEVAAIVQYLADLKPASRLVPAAGTFERTQLKEWLNFIAAEIHKGFSTLFNPAAGEQWQAAARTTLAKRLNYLADHLKQNAYLMGPVMTVTDIYLFVVLSWAPAVSFDLAPWPLLQQFVERIYYRRSVAEALAAEKLAAE